MAGIPERTVERSRSCNNCLHWVSGKDAEGRFLEKTGFTPGDMDIGLTTTLNVLSNPKHKGAIQSWILQGYTEQRAIEFVMRDEYGAIKKKLGLAPKVFLAIRQGLVGYCGVNAVEADFTDRAELCGDSSGQACRWSGKSGFSGAGSAAGRAGMPIDELRDVVDHDAKLRTRGDKK